MHYFCAAARKSYLEKRMVVPQKGQLQHAQVMFDKTVLGHMYLSYQSEYLFIFIFTWFLDTPDSNHGFC